MAALVFAVAVLAAEAPKPEEKPEAGAAEVEAAVVPKPKPEVRAKVEKKLPPTVPEKRPAPPPRPKPYFVSASCGVSFPFAGGTNSSTTDLRFEWPAFEWGIECGMDMPNAEVRLSFDSRTYHPAFDPQLGKGNWMCDRLLVCGGWRTQFLEAYEFVIGGGLGVIWNNADRGSSEYYEDIREDKHSFAGRLYACLRYRPDWPVEIELYGRLTFAKADYDIIVGSTFSNTQDLSAGEFGLAVRRRF